MNGKGTKWREQTASQTKVAMENMEQRVKLHSKHLCQPGQYATPVGKTTVL